MGPDQILKEVNERKPALDLYDVYDDATKALHDMAGLIPDEDVREEARERLREFMETAKDPLVDVIRGHEKGRLRNLSG